MNYELFAQPKLGLARENVYMMNDQDDEINRILADSIREIASYMTKKT